MDRRLKLHEKLVAIAGVKKVYFQPPASVSLEYPCLIYKRTRPQTRYADNRLYFGQQEYQVTVIDRNPDSKIPEAVEQLPLCSRTSYFAADGLNHDVFMIFI